MARIPQPTNSLIALYDMEFGSEDDEGSVYYDIYRAYQRVDGKFLPIGWSIQSFNIQRQTFGIRVYTDKQVREYLRSILIS